MVGNAVLIGTAGINAGIDPEAGGEALSKGDVAGQTQKGPARIGVILAGPLGGVEA